MYGSAFKSSLVRIDPLETIPDIRDGNFINLLENANIIPYQAQYFHNISTDHRVFPQVNIREDNTRKNLVRFKTTIPTATDDTFQPSRYWVRFPHRGRQPGPDDLAAKAYISYQSEYGTEKGFSEQWKWYATSNERRLPPDHIVDFVQDGPTLNTYVSFYAEMQIPPQNGRSRSFATLLPEDSEEYSSAMKELQEILGPRFKLPAEKQ